VIAQARAEFLKIRSTRTTLGLALGLVAIVLLFVLLTALLSGVSDISQKDNQRSLFGIGSFAGVFAALAGIMLVTGEFRFGTIRPTFLFTPRRSIVLVAKVIASILAGLVFAVIGEALSVGIGALILNERGISLALGRHDYELMTLGTRALPAASRTTTGRPSRTYAARLKVVPRSIPTTEGFMQTEL